MSQRLDFFFSSASAAMPQVKGGKLEDIGSQHNTSHELFGLECQRFLKPYPLGSTTLVGGLFCASGHTQKHHSKALNKEINQILALPDVKAQMEKDSLAVPANSSQEFTNYMASEAVKFERLVTEADEIGQFKRHPLSLKTQAVAWFRKAGQPCGTCPAVLSIK
jgi:hypothetical protein